MRMITLALITLILMSMIVIPASAIFSINGVQAQLSNAGYLNSAWSGPCPTVYGNGNSSLSMTGNTEAYTLTGFIPGFSADLIYWTPPGAYTTSSTSATGTNSYSPIFVVQWDGSNSQHYCVEVNSGYSPEYLAQSVHFNPNGLPFPPTINTTSYATPSAAYMIGNFSSLQGVAPGSAVLATVSNYLNTTFRSTSLVCNVSGSQTSLETTSQFNGYSSQFPFFFPNRAAVCYLQESTYPNSLCDQQSCTQMYAVGGSGIINQTPVAEFNIDFTTCDPIGADFIDNSTFSSFSTGKTWLWDFGDGATATTQDASHIFPSTNTYNVKLTVSDSFGTSNITYPVSLSACVGSGLFGNTTYYFPVTITDAFTGVSISNSTLAVADQATMAWYNRSSVTGKFNVTGNGSYGGIPIQSGDTLLFVGNASGYVSNGYALYATPDVAGITQYIPLIPTGYIPLDTEFTMIANAYDSSNSVALQGVSISILGGLTKSTSVSGTAVFYNLTPDTTYTLTASKTGYTSITKTFSGTNGSVLGVDIAMSATSVNPTYTVTQTTLPGGVTVTTTPSSPTAAASSALEFWKNGLDILSSFIYVIVLFTLLWTFIYVASGNIPGFKTRGGFLGKLPGVFGKKRGKY